VSFAFLEGEFMRGFGGSLFNCDDPAGMPHLTGFLGNFRVLLFNPFAPALALPLSKVTDTRLG
jgi:hypothetical protein